MSDGTPATKARDIMSSPVRTVQHHLPVSRVLITLHQWNVTGAPVLDAEGRVIGVVSSLDLILAGGMNQLDRRLCDLPEPLFVRDKVLSVSPGAPIKEVLKTLCANRIGRVLVMDGERLLGIITRKDMLRHYISHLRG